MDKEKKEEIVESFFTKLLSGDAKESSKRFLAIYVVVILGTIVTGVALWQSVDYVYLLITWLSFAGTLLGLSEYTKNVKAKQDASIEIEKFKSGSSDSDSVFDAEEK